ncbi:MAG: thioredoxin domain-containing protein [Armatimonadetes bacterium]|nr:thioredoxin domain-containing protein [Armatimonadota bacterium]
MPNRLAQSASPYLLQHKDNPVDWQPWDEEAWAVAVQQDLPVFLSVGYSSCHWCHVMAHESFEDEEVAAALNKSFVCIKLDREERPDIDEVYMTAVQLATGHGGWPMSVFLTPDKKPFFAATYIPKEARHGHPGIVTVVNALAKAWAEQRDDVQKNADEFAAALSSALERSLAGGNDPITVYDLDSAVEALHQDFDTENGGFGDRPKFPPHAALRFLLDYVEHRRDLGADPGDLPDRALHMALHTLEQIARGGIHDHVRGGFHRYSTDERWHLPHFEKMLYDNAQLLGAFSQAARLAEPRQRRLINKAVSGITMWLKSSMTTSDGIFMSALDADSEGEEGTFYTPTVEDVRSALGDRASVFCQSFGLKREGNFRDEATGALTGRNVLHLEGELSDDLELDLTRLSEAPAWAAAPARDDKCIAAWNGLMISALVQAGEVELAERAAEKWCELDRLPHMLTRGQAAGQPFLDDVAAMADAFLDLSEATGGEAWRLRAESLAAKLEDFRDASPGYFFTSSGHEPPLGRTKPFMDGATPSPNALAARVLRRLGRTAAAWQTVRAGAGWIRQAPRASESLLRELTHLLRSPEHQDTIGNLVMDVKATLAPPDLTPDDEGWAYTELRLEMPTGIHINSNEPAASWLVPTTVEIDGAYGEAAYPETTSGRYDDSATIHLRLRRKGASQEFAIRVRFQACTESECHAPQEIELEGTIR